MRHYGRPHLSVAASTGGIGVSSQVFISYSREDRSYVEMLTDHLRAEGFDVWVDDRIPTGHISPARSRQQSMSAGSLCWS